MPRPTCKFWDRLADANAATASDHEGLIATAETARASAAAEAAKAVEQATRAKDRITRIERGENVDGGLGKPTTFADLITGARFTKTEIERLMQLSQVIDVYGFDFAKQVIVEARDHAERKMVRALHRLIPDEDGDDT